MNFYQKSSLKIFGSLSVGLLAVQLAFVFDYIMLLNFNKNHSIGLTIIIISTRPQSHLTHSAFPFILKFTQIQIGIELEELTLTKIPNIHDQFTAIRYCQIHLSLLKESKRGTDSNVTRRRKIKVDFGLIGRHPIFPLTHFRSHLKSHQLMSGEKKCWMLLYG